MDFIDLFAGIGGFSLGLEGAGMTAVAQVENDPWCLSILNKHWPLVPKFEDVRDVGKHNLPSAELICGGFPCQPHSVAGNRLGEKDDRNLWPEFVRFVEEVQPTWVIGENVPGIATSALDNAIVNVESTLCLRGSDSDYYRRILTRQEFLFLHQCCQELEEKGFEVTVFNLPACAFDAKHKRERIFIVGYSEHNGQLAKQKLRSNEAASVERGKEKPLTARQSERADRPDNGGSLQGSPSGGERDSLGEVLADSTGELSYERDNNRENGRNSPSQLRTGSSTNILAYADNPRLQGGKKQRGNSENGEKSRNEQSARRGSFDRERNEPNEWESKPSLGGTLDGLSASLDGALTNWATGWDDGVPKVAHGVPDRVNKLKGLGNAIFPPAVKFLAENILAVDKIINQ